LPEHIRPHPKAPPRKGKVGPRKRKTAILTDTPEREAIEKALRKREQKKNKSTSKWSKQSEATKPVTKTKPKRKKPRKKKVEDYDSSDDECHCLVCVEPYPNSRSREKWVQCIACKDWAHEECTAVLKGQLFVCQNCESDYNSDDA